MTTALRSLGLLTTTGAQVSVAVYTHNFHAMSIVRKIILRVKSWENYVFFMQGLDSVH